MESAFEQMRGPEGLGGAEDKRGGAGGRGGGRSVVAPPGTRDFVFCVDMYTNGTEIVFL